MQTTKSEQADHGKQSPPGSIHVSAIVSWSAQHGRISKISCVHARAILVEGAMGGGEGVENPPSDSVYSGPALTRCRFPFHICDSANAGLSKMKENA